MNCPDNDRSENVKAEFGYKTLAKSVFTNVDSSVRHISLAPYALCYMVCARDQDRADFDGEY